MKKILSTLFLVIGCIAAQGQVQQRLATAIQPSTGSSPTLVFAQIIPNAQVSVCVYNTPLSCVTPVTIYSDVNLTIPITQPLTSSASGTYQYYIQGGTQVVEKVCGTYNQCYSNAVYFALGTTNPVITFPIPINEGGTNSGNAQGAASNIVNGNIIYPIQVGPTYYCDQYSGADFAAKVNACLAAVYTAGGGTADASHFTCPTNCHLNSANITVGDGSHSATLILPAGIITRDKISGNSRQLLYNSYVSIFGQNYGTTLIEGASDDVGVLPTNTGAVSFVHIRDISIVDTGSQTPGVPTFQFGGSTLFGGDDTLNSTVENVTTGGADIGILVDSIGGCTCYNKFYNVDAAGGSIGLKTQNDSGYPSGVNSNQWYGGRFTGPIGILDSGTSQMSYYNPDLESNTSSSGAVLFVNTDEFNPGNGYAIGDTVHITGGSGTAIATVTNANSGHAYAVAVSSGGTGYSNIPSVATTHITGSGTGLRLDVLTQAYMVLTGGAIVTSPYEEAGGGDYLCGNGNTLTGSGTAHSWLDAYYDGSVGASASMYCYTGGIGYNPDSGYDFSWMSNGAPTSIGISPRYNGGGGWIGPYIAFFGQTFNGGMSDSYFNVGYVSTSLVPVNLWSTGPAWAGPNSSTGGTNNFEYGPSPWTVGETIVKGGTLARGRTTYSSLGTPPAPSAAAIGGTGTNYTYAVIAVDSNGGITQASNFTTVSGPASLDGTHYITITFPWILGAACMGVVKTDTAHGLGVNNGVSADNPPCNNASGGVGFSGTLYNAGPLSSGIITATDVGQGTTNTTLPITGHDTSSDVIFGGLTFLGGPYSHAGTQIPVCGSTILYAIAAVSDASSLTPGTAYSPSAGAGSDGVNVQCALTGSTYAWQTL